MTSEKKNSSPAPESVAMEELKKASKENMNLVRAHTCLSLPGKELTDWHLFCCDSRSVSSAHRPFCTFTPDHSACFEFRKDKACRLVCFCCTLATTQEGKGLFDLQLTVHYGGKSVSVGTQHRNWSWGHEEHCLRLAPHGSLSLASFCRT